MEKGDFIKGFQEFIEFKMFTSRYSLDRAFYDSSN